MKMMKKDRAPERGKKGSSNARPDVGPGAGRATDMPSKMLSRSDTVTYYLYIEI